MEPKQFPPNPFSDPEGFSAFAARVADGLHKNVGGENRENLDDAPSTISAKAESSKDNQETSLPASENHSSDGNVAQALKELRSKMPPNPFANPKDFHDMAQRMHILCGAMGIMRENVKDIGIAEVLAYLGAKTHRQDKNKWQYGSWNINTKGQLWFNFNEANSKEKKSNGGGPITLVKHLLDMDDDEIAIQWLADEFGGRADLDNIKVDPTKSAKTEKKEFVIPENHPENLKYVKEYLHNTRKLPNSLIDRLISEGKIYSDRMRNCVFFANGDPGMAEIRGTDSNFKGITTGGTRTVGFTVPPIEKTSDGKIITSGVAIVEAAIDAMSLHVFRPDLFVISAAGANFEFPTKVAEEAIKLGYRVFAAFDNDDAGDSAANHLLTTFQGNVERIVPPGGVKDWNEALKANPNVPANYENALLKANSDDGKRLSAKPF